MTCGRIELWTMQIHWTAKFIIYQMNYLTISINWQGVVLDHIFVLDMTPEPYIDKNFLVRAYANLCKLVQAKKDSNLQAQPARSKF